MQAEIADSSFVVAQTTLAGVLLFSGAAKVLDLRSFARDVANYRVLPEPATRAFAVVLPIVEISAGIVLVAGIQIRAVSLLAAFTFTTFVVAVAVNLVRGEQPNCGCFGVAIRETVSGWTIARQIALIGLAIYLFLLLPSDYFYSSHGRDILPALLISVVATAAAVLVAQLLMLRTAATAGSGSGHTQ